MRLFYFLLLGALCAQFATVEAQVYSNRLTLDELVKRADIIVVANCDERETSWTNQNLVTHYTLRPSEFMKGYYDLNKDGQFEIEELGGVLKNPPIRQQVAGEANIKKGEEVLLFLKQNQKKFPDKTAEDDPRLLASQKIDGLRIVGMAQGRFTVVEHPESGEKIVTKPSALAMQVKRINEGKAPMVLDKSTTETLDYAPLPDANLDVVKTKLAQKLDRSLAATAARADKNVDARGEEFLNGAFLLNTVRAKVREKMENHKAETK